MDSTCDYPDGSHKKNCANPMKTITKLRRIIILLDHSVHCAPKLLSKNAQIIFQLVRSV